MKTLNILLMPLVVLLSTLTCIFSILYGLWLIKKKPPTDGSGKLFKLLGYILWPTKIPEFFKKQLKKLYRPSMT